MVVARGLIGAVLVAGLCSCGGFFGSSSPPATTSDDTISKDATLYERLGGVDVLRVLVDEWLVVASSDERIRDFFAGADISRLKLRLVERICVQVEGPCLYRGREMYAAHADLGLEDSHLRAFLQALEPAMQRAKIEGKAADELRIAIRGLAEELAIAVVR
jgi:hemoglobin